MNTRINERLACERGVSWPRRHRRNRRRRVQDGVIGSSIRTCARPPIAAGRRSIARAIARPPETTPVPAIDNRPPVPRPGRAGRQSPPRPTRRDTPGREPTIPQPVGREDLVEPSLGANCTASTISLRPTVSRANVRAQSSFHLSFQSVLLEWVDFPKATRVRCFAGLTTLLQKKAEWHSSAREGSNWR